jgi:hypothetical protein
MQQHVLKNLRVYLFKALRFPAIAGLLFPAGLLLQECRKDNDVPDKVYLDKMTIRHNRITSLSHFEGNTLLFKSEYIFRDGSVTLISTNGKKDTIQIVVYKIGENGYAESSKAYPERIEVTQRDTFFVTRVFYEYDAQDQLITEYIGDLRNDTLRHEYTYIGDTMLIPNIRYSYESGEMSVRSPLFPYSYSLPPCHIDYRYGPSDKLCKLDYSTNGILGKPGKYLIAYSLFAEECSCSPAITTNQFYYTYRLNNDDYVIQVKEVAESCHNQAFAGTTITNYEIHFQ